jgi:hypothetical protein
VEVQTFVVLSIAFLALEIFFGRKGVCPTLDTYKYAANWAAKKLLGLACLFANSFSTRAHSGVEKIFPRRRRPQLQRNSAVRESLTVVAKKFQNISLAPL